VVTVDDDPAGSQYVARVGGEVAGVAAYELHPRMVVFTHTTVDPAFGGQGVGGALVRRALDDVRSRGLRIVPVCPFVRDWVAKHPDYQDLVVPSSSRPRAVDADPDA
jgi:predicted GNAT family acetyltransferase